MLFCISYPWFIFCRLDLHFSLLGTSQKKKKRIKKREKKSETLCISIFSYVYIYFLETRYTFLISMDANWTLQMLVYLAKGQKPFSWRVTKGKGVFGYRLFAENWKHYSKIIFKYVNSAVRSKFILKFVFGWLLWVREQCHGTHIFSAKCTNANHKRYPNVHLIKRMFLNFLIIFLY